MINILKDLRFGLRMLAKNRVFTVVTVSTLALGIGVNSAVFSIMDALLFRELPYKHSSQIANIRCTLENAPQLKSMCVSYPNFLDWKKQNTVFENMGVSNNGDLFILGAVG